jgi:hypothetical protein
VALRREIPSATVVLMAIRLVQPGRLGDVVEGIQRLLPYEVDADHLKKTLSSRLQQFREDELICLYAGQRYMLMAKGQEIVDSAGIKVDIDDRRMFLLKETRRASKSARSDAREGSL